MGYAKYVLTVSVSELIIAILIDVQTFQEIWKQLRICRDISLEKKGYFPIKHMETSCKSIPCSVEFEE